MVIVNTPGDWGTVYWPLLHAEWHGWTPTDLIFPFFVFIVGVSIVLSKKSTARARPNCSTRGNHLRTGSPARALSALRCHDGADHGRPPETCNLLSRGGPGLSGRGGQDRARARHCRAWRRVGVADRLLDTPDARAGARRTCRRSHGVGQPRRLDRSDRDRRSAPLAAIEDVGSRGSAQHAAGDRVGTHRHRCRARARIDSTAVGQDQDSSPLGSRVRRRRSRLGLLVSHQQESLDELVCALHERARRDAARGLLLDRGCPPSRLRRSADKLAFGSRGRSS